MKTFLNFKILILLLIAGFCIVTIPKVWPQQPIFDIGQVVLAPDQAPDAATCDDFLAAVQDGDYLIFINRTENAAINLQIPRPGTNMMYYGGTVPANDVKKVRIKYLRQRHNGQLLDVNYTLSMKLRKTTVFSAPKTLKILIQEAS